MAIDEIAHAETEGTRVDHERRKMLTALIATGALPLSAVDIKADVARLRPLSEQCRGHVVERLRRMAGMIEHGDLELYGYSMDCLGIAETEPAIDSMGQRWKDYETSGLVVFTLVTQQPRKG